MSISHLSRRFFIAAFASIVAATALPAYAATKIQRLVSPGGIEAWVVQDATVPLIAMEYAFDGGAAQDPADKPGVASMVAGLLDEGAGELDSKTFHERLERRAIELGFSAARDHLRGSLRMLTENRDEAFDLLRLALTQARFDTPDIERIRAQIMSGLRRETSNPGSLANLKFMQTAFGDHPYGRPANGTLVSVPQIDVGDLRGFTARNLARDTLHVAVVGDIDLQTLGALLDKTFGALPARATLTPVPDIIAAKPPQRHFVPLDVPQTNIVFGGPGIRRGDPNFMAAYVVNHIIGGGGLTGRLYKEVREKRGLAYGIGSGISGREHSDTLVIGTSTRSDRAAETLSVIKDEVKKMAEGGPSADELATAKKYLIGAYAINNLDSSMAVARTLVELQRDDLPIDYMARRDALINGVTLEQAKAAAQKLLTAAPAIMLVGPADKIGD